MTKIFRVLVVIAIMAATVALSSAPASAAGTNCSWAPGKFGATSCVGLKGDNLLLRSAWSSYTSYGDNVCNVQGKHQYRKSGKSYDSISYTSTATGCAITGHKKTPAKSYWLFVEEDTRLRTWVKSVSYTHLPSPRDRQKSRMPSSA